MSRITKTIDEKLDIAIFSLEEDAVYEDIREAIDEYLKGGATKFSIWDFTKLKKHLTSAEIKIIGEQVGALSDIKKERFDILVVPNILQFGLARMYSAYTEITTKEYAPFKTVVFRTRNAAISWIQQKKSE